MHAAATTCHEMDDFGKMPPAAPHLAHLHSRRSSLCIEDAKFISVVCLHRLQTALKSQPAETVLTALYETNDLLQRVPIEEAALTSYAIISYRQLHSKHDKFGPCRLPRRG